MINPIELKDMIALHSAIKSNGNELHAEIIAQLYLINCEYADSEDIYLATEEILSTAERVCAEADDAIMNRVQDAADVRADDVRAERLGDGV